jgi:putative ABC transport system permease protein
MAWLTMSLRRLRDDRVPTLGLVGLVLITAFVFAIGPRLLGRVSDDALRSEVAATSGAIRNVQLIQERRIGPTADDPLGAVDAAGADLESQVPPAVRGLFVDRVSTVDTPRWRVVSETKVPSLLSLRFQQGAAERVRFVSGRAPTGETRTVDLPAGTPTPIGGVVVYEVGLSTATAEAMGVGVGDVLQLALDPTDPLARTHTDRAAVDVVGIFEVTEPGALYWSDDTTLARPTQRALTADLVFTNAIALLAPEAYPQLMASTDPGGLPLRYSWRFYVDPSRLQAGRVDDLLVDLRRMESVFPTSAVVVGVARGTILRSRLLAFIEGQQARWRSAQAVLTTVGIGPATVAAAALGLVVLLGSGRRRASLGLSRSRGASPGQIVGATLVEGILVTLPPALLAMALALAAIPIGLDPPTAVIPFVVAAVTVGLLLAIVAPIALGAAVDGARRVGEGRRSGPRRLAAEALVIALAAGGALLLRDRGIRGASSTAELGAADPFIAAVPALAGLAAGLIVLRVFPIPVRGLAILAALRRDLVPVLAMRRTTRGGSAAPILLVLMATASVGAFSLATLAHLDRAATAVGWQEVGAPVRLVEGSGRLRDDFDPLALPGVSAAAGAYQASLTDAGTSGVELLALDAAAYRSVGGGTPGDPSLPGELIAASAGPLPAIVSPDGVVDGIAPGDRFELIILGERTAFRAVAVRDAFPTLPVGGPFVVVDRGQLAAQLGGATFRTTTIFLSAPDTAVDGIRAATAAQAPGVTVESRAERSAEIGTAPVVVAVRVGVNAAAATAIAYAAIALAAALALTGAARASESAHLRTFGLARRDAVGLTVVEHGPTVALAIALGVLFGLGAFVALRPGLGLGAIVGSSLDVPLEVGLGQLVLLIMGIVAVVTLAIGLGAVLQREPAATAALRRGIE